MGLDRLSSGGLTTVTTCPIFTFAFARSVPLLISEVFTRLELTSITVASLSPAPTTSASFFDRRVTLVITGAPSEETSEAFNL